MVGISCLTLQGCGNHPYTDKTYQRKPEIKMNAKQGTNLTHIFKQLEKDNYRPQELMRLFNSNQQLLSKSQKQDITDIIYKSSQNNSLFFNQYGTFLSGELQYALTNHPTNNPLAHLNELDNNLIIGFVRESQNQMLNVEYIGNSILAVQPDFKKETTLFKYPSADLKDFLQLGVQQQKDDPINANGNIDINKALSDYVVGNVWLAKHPDNEFVDDAKSLLNRDLQVIFSTYSTFNYSNQKQTRLKDSVYDQLLKLRSSNKYGNRFKDLVNGYLKEIKGNHVSSKARADIQNQINSIYGASRFRTDNGKTTSMNSIAKLNE